MSPLPLDGYTSEKLKSYSEAQGKINARLQEIALEIKALPKAQKSSADFLDEGAFNMQSYGKYAKIKKEYLALLEQADVNLREMRLIAIDNLLEQIKQTLDENATPQQ